MILNEKTNNKNQSISVDLNGIIIVRVFHLRYFFTLILSLSIFLFSRSVMIRKNKLVSILLAELTHHRTRIQTECGKHATVNEKMPKH